MPSKQVVQFGGQCRVFHLLELLKLSRAERRKERWPNVLRPFDGGMPRSRCCHGAGCAKGYAWTRGSHGWALGFVSRAACRLVSLKGNGIRELHRYGDFPARGACDVCAGLGHVGTPGRGAEQQNSHISSLFTPAESRPLGAHFDSRALRQLFEASACQALNSLARLTTHRRPQTAVPVRSMIRYYSRRRVQSYSNATKV